MQRRVEKSACQTSLSQEQITKHYVVKAQRFEKQDEGSSSVEYEIRCML